MMMLRGMANSSSVQRHHHGGLEPPSSTVKPMAHDFFSPLSYSRSSAGSTMSQQPHATSFPPPPPPSIQKSVLVEGMSQMSPFPPTTEMSRLLSLSGNCDVETPRSILSNKSLSSERMKEELQQVLQYLDGMTFVTPYKPEMSRIFVTPAMSHFKPPRPTTASRPILQDRSNQVASARDPTPTKLKPIALDLLRENPDTAPSFFLHSTMEENEDSSLIVELSTSTTTNEDEQMNNVADPPTEDSKLWTSPQLRRVPRDPEPTREQKGESSILLGTAFADYDLMPRRTTTSSSSQGLVHQTAWATPMSLHRQDDDDDSLSLVYHVDSTTHQENSLHLPATPAALNTNMEAKLEELCLRQPESPRDAKEWLQTAMLALQDARAERDAARQWARDMKLAVQKWAEEQRKLIRCETTTRMDALEEREQQVRFQTEALANLESLVQQLHLDFQSTQSQRLESESQLQQLILDQQQHIHTLSQQLTNMEQTVSEGLSQAIGRTPKSELSSQFAFPTFVDRPAAAATTNSSQKSTRSSSSHRVRKALPNGKGHVIVYSSGVEKEVHNDGTTIIRYTNGDVETNFGTSIAYFHAAEQVLQITNTRDASVLLEYPNGQIERHYANGRKAVWFPDGTKALLSADGIVEGYPQ